jgi:disulfide bond formation protein DsbB
MANLTNTRALGISGSSESKAAYAAGAFVLVVALGAIVAALGFEHIGGYLPCPLCLQQRYGYYAGIPLAFIGLVCLSSGRPRIAAFVFFAIALAFLVNGGLGVYHAGAEWKYWPGPASCGTIQPIGGAAGGILGKLATTKVIACDEASWRFAGLSFAGWNVVISILLFAAALKAAFSAAPQD